MSNHIVFENIVKKYGDVTVIKDLSFRIEQGELFTLLGPSGCGKTTLLRMVAGFNSVEGGAIYLGGQLLNQVPPHLRDTGMVFQNYAVFPHMTVKENIGYGLKARGVKGAELEKRIAEAMKMVQIEAYGERSPAELSGGQQQRVALARAIAIRPRVLLMDEPLSNLDAKLRIQMRENIRKIQKEVGITTIYVTHDQEEALAISDRIAVMKDGVIQQIASPEVIYKRPANEFVAAFIGTSNVLPGKLLATADGAALQLEEGPAWPLPQVQLVPGAVKISIRPEEFQLTEPGTGLSGIIKFTAFLGDFVKYEIELTGGTVVEVNEYRQAAERVRQTGEKVGLEVVSGKINVFTADGSTSLMQGNQEEKV